MPQQTDPAVPVTLSAVTSQPSSQKIRIVGRLTEPCSPSSPFIELTDGKQNTLLVDISLCLEPFKSSPWLREKHSLVMLVGYLEDLDDDRAAAGQRRVVLRALLAQETSDLQLGLWERAIREREELESLKS
ncbi:hypothetical protein BXZ70DRAFT_373398 [Cristinia sonorae]|uniref:Uncharacterized protein n=1 Tax=Cristinia sonorae TaxID=1940300 RepID=A0A8K0UKD4_9AGAR|nr:hypothetical protein BXZ70DRAFT_373398 [Cristinia sonorae]